MNSEQALMEIEPYQGDYGKYKLQSEIDRGHFGVVFKALVLEYDNHSILRPNDIVVIKAQHDMKDCEEDILDKCLDKTRLK